MDSEQDERVRVALDALHGRERSGCEHFAGSPAPDLCCDLCKMASVVEALDNSGESGTSLSQR